MKKLIIVFILCISSLAGYAPNNKELVKPLEIAVGEVLNPYERIWKAVCLVESNCNPLAYNKKEHAVGIAQIREVRLRDYNKKTKSSLKLSDCYNPDISKMIFMYYAENIGFRNYDKIIRDWNGSGKQTYVYLRKVRKYM